MSRAAAVVAAVAGLGVAVTSGQTPETASTEAFALRVVTAGLEQPFDVTWGPDDHLWVTERPAGRVVRVNPTSGAKETAVTIAEVRGTEGEQDGLLGLALHPGLWKGSDFVYLAYTYDTSKDPKAPRLRVKIRRYTFDRAKKTLRAPVDVLAGLPSSSDHNGGRLLFGPDGKLYYTIGDQGANQFAHFCEPNRAQELPTAAQLAARDYVAYQGKVLRLNLDGSIPEDNPLLGGVRSHVYAYGFRNPQGLAFAPDGRLFATDHGAKTDDEIDLVEAGGNYGWPHVSGFQDDKAYAYANWSASAGTPCASLTYSDYRIPPSVPQAKESEWREPFRPPLRTFYTVESGHPFRERACAQNAMFFICWPTIAPSGVAVYTGGGAGVPGWEDSLLVTSLKHGAVYRMPLARDGSLAPGQPLPVFQTTNRYRDLAIGPDRRTFYVITDSGGFTRAPASGATSFLENRGAILEFRFQEAPVTPAGSGAGNR
jgi:quinoprotein glucose dehydrogenase